MDCQQGGNVNIARQTHRSLKLLFRCLLLQSLLLKSLFGDCSWRKVFWAETKTL